MTIPAHRMLRSIALLALAAMTTTTATILGAQESDSTVAQVQRLVSAGNRTGARLLADSLLAQAQEGTPAYGEALYARALASSSAVEAERDYLRVSVEYSLSPRAEDATMMVAQLKLARSDRIGARRNFERLVREHPGGSQVAKAAFWAGRLAVEDGDEAHGCPLLGKARSAVTEQNVELANQIAYYAQRCSPSALAGPPPAPAVLPPAPQTPPPAVDRSVRTPPRPAQRPAAPVVPPPDSVVERQPVQEAVTPEPREQVVAPSVPGKEYTVQVAAFPRERDAVALAQVLIQRGFPSRVWGAKPPYRVRVGRYATFEEAEAVRARLKASRVNGVVVDAEQP